MAYSQLEELTSRRQEKVALFFTAEHMAGVLAVGLPVYIATLGTVFWLRVVILLAAAVLGVLITSDLGGMASYERVLWWVRGRLRRRLTVRTLRPAELSAAPVIQGNRAVPLGGPIRRLKGHRTRLAPYPPAALAARTAPAHRARSTARAVTASNVHAGPTDVATPIVAAGAGGQE